MHHPALCIWLLLDNYWQEDPSADFEPDQWEHKIPRNENKTKQVQIFYNQGREAKIVHYDIEGYKVHSIAEEDQKLLGRFLFFEGKS